MVMAVLSSECCESILCPTKHELGLVPDEGPLFEFAQEARGSGRLGIVAVQGTSGRREAPAQMGGAGLARLSIAQQEDRSAGRGSPQAEAAADGEIEEL